MISRQLLPLVVQEGQRRWHQQQHRRRRVRGSGIPGDEPNDTSVLRIVLLVLLCVIQSVTSLSLPIVCLSSTTFHGHHHCNNYPARIRQVPSSFSSSSTSSSSSSRSLTRLYYQSNNNNKPKPLSNSERERREEEKRKQERKNDVIIHQTSALPNAQDYSIHSTETEQQWLKQASYIEQQVYKLTEQGLKAMQQLQLPDAHYAFQQVFQLKPNAYVWQAGIVQFYYDSNHNNSNDDENHHPLRYLSLACDIFCQCAQWYEQQQIGGPASEERIWRDACVLKYVYSSSHHSDMFHQQQPQEQQQHRDTKRKSLNDIPEVQTLFPVIPDPTMVDQDEMEDDEKEKDVEFRIFTRKEHRKVMILARNLFAAAIQQDQTAQSNAIAALTSLINQNNNTSGGTHFFSSLSSTTATTTPTHDRNRLRKLNALFYLGLYYDCIGNISQSKHCFKQALSLLNNHPSSNHEDSDIVQILPLLHMSVRGWLLEDNSDDDNNNNIVIMNNHE